MMQADCAFQFHDPVVGCLGVWALGLDLNGEDGGRAPGGAGGFSEQVYRVSWEAFRDSWWVRGHSRHYCGERLSGDLLGLRVAEGWGSLVAPAPCSSGGASAGPAPSSPACARRVGADTPACARSPGGGVLCRQAGFAACAPGCVCCFPPGGQRLNGLRDPGLTRPLVLPLWAEGAVLAARWGCSGVPGAGGRSQTAGRGGGQLELCVPA